MDLEEIDLRLDKIFERRDVVLKGIEILQKFLMDFAFKYLPDRCKICGRFPEIGAKVKEYDDLYIELHSLYDEEETLGKKMKKYRQK